MKRTLITTFAAVALAAVASISIVAHPRQGQGPGQGRGMGMGPGGPGGAGPMMFLRDVDLTDAQRDQVRSIMEAHRAERGPGKIGELEKQLQLAILGDTVDQQKLGELKNAIAAAHVEQLAERIEVETRISQVLTAEQRAKAREMVSASGPGGPGRGRRGGGPR